MALIGKIRKRSGLLLIIIGVALAAFVMGDLFKSSGGRGRITNIAVVNGDPISYFDFERQFEENVELQKMQTGKENFTQQELYQIRQQTWEQMVQEQIMQEQMDELGIIVTEDELLDMIQGANPHPYVVQSFSNPQTGEYNPSMAMNFIRNLDQADPQSRQQWLRIEQAIKEERLREKYYNLIRKGYYIPQEFARIYYHEFNDSRSFLLLSKSYNQISDSAISLTDEDYEAYYEKHKHEYKQKEPSRSIDFVVFNIVPTAEDQKAIEEDVLEIKKEFQSDSLENINMFVNANSDENYDSTFFKKGELSLEIDSIMFNSPIGTVYGPYIENESFYLTRLVDIQTRSDSLKAEHILVAYAGAMRASPEISRTKEIAKQRADSLFNLIKRNPEMLSSIAVEASDDMSARENNGDLGWFLDGTMVPSFNEAVINGNIGDVTMVESPFGFHIIHILDKTKAQKKVRIANIVRYIEPSNETIQDTYQRANQFAASSRTVDAFEKTVASQGLNKRSHEMLKPMDNRLPGLNNPREIIRWAFDQETEPGMVSDVFDLQEQYVVVALKSKMEEGIPELEVLKPYLERLAKRDKKAEILMNELNQAKGSSSTLQEIANKANADKIDTINVLRFNATNIPKVGPEQELIGILWTMEESVISDAIKGDLAVYMVKISEKVVAEEQKDYKIYTNAPMKQFTNQVEYSVYPALQENADVEDNRLHFY